MPPYRPLLKGFSALYQRPPEALTQGFAERIGYQVVSVRLDAVCQQRHPKKTNADGPPMTAVSFKRRASECGEHVRISTVVKPELFGSGRAATPAKYLRK